MAFLSAASVKISSSGSAGSPGAAVALWSGLVAYAAGQLVSFNGGLYQTLSSVPPGIVPPVEAATPATPGAPRYVKLTAGGTVPEDYLSTKTYYDGQVVVHNGIAYRLDGPISASGTSPAAGAPWTMLGDGIGLSVFESQELTNGNLENKNGGLTSVEFRQIFSERNRIKHHRLKLITTAVPPAAGVSLIDVKFPTPLKTGRPPSVVLSPESWLSGPADLVFTLLTSGNDTIGYRIIAGTALPASSTLDVCVRIDESRA